MHIIARRAKRYIWHSQLSPQAFLQALACIIDPLSDQHDAPLGRHIEIRLETLDDCRFRLKHVPSTSKRYQIREHLTGEVTPTAAGCRVVCNPVDLPQPFYVFFVLLPMMMALLRAGAQMVIYASAVALIMGYLIYWLQNIEQPAVKPLLQTITVAAGVECIPE